MRTPFHRPRPAPISTVAMTATASGTFMNLRNEARIIVRRVIADPGERSMPPLMMTSVDPIPRSDTMLTWRARLRRFSTMKNLSVVRPTRSVTTAVATTGPMMDELVTLRAMAFPLPAAIRHTAWPTNTFSARYFLSDLLRTPRFHDRGRPCTMQMVSLMARSSSRSELMRMTPFAFAGQSVDEVVDLYLCSDVDTLCRLIEDENIRPRENPARNKDLLLVPPGQELH